MLNILINSLFDIFAELFVLTGSASISNLYLPQFVHNEDKQTKLGRINTGIETTNI